MRKFWKLLHLLGNTTWRRGLSHGVAAAVEHAAFLRTLDVGTVLDAGANRGQFALAVRRFLPRAKVISFEPLAAPAARLEKLFARDPLVELIRAALGPVDGSARIHVSRRSDSSSLLPIGRLQTQIFPGTEEVRAEDVPVFALDNVVKADELAGEILLKIDVQGFELELLRGGEISLQAIDHVYVEVSFVQLYEGQALAHEVIAWLALHDFVLAGIYHVSFDRAGRSVQADMHFCRARGRKMQPH